MSGIELNKIAASILLSSLIIMLVGIIANILYKPTLQVSKRGYQITIAQENTGNKENLIATNQNEDINNIENIMANANADSGANIIKKCVSCHTFNKDGVHKIGPNLSQIFNAPKGKKDGFKYSKAMLTAGGKWDEKSLFKFLKNPRKYIPGTKMSFAGIRKANDIANIIAYLQKQNPNHSN
jgi:cytochrome c